MRHQEAAQATFRSLFLPSPTLENSMPFFQDSEIEQLILIQRCQVHEQCLLPLEG